MKRNGNPAIAVRGGLAEKGALPPLLAILARCEWFAHMRLSQPELAGRDIVDFNADVLREFQIYRTLPAPESNFHRYCAPNAGLVSKSLWCKQGICMFLQAFLSKTPCRPLLPQVSG